MDETMNDLLARVASVDPAPGGGSVSALSGALGAALCAMVWRLTRTKSDDVEGRRVIDERITALDALRERLAGAFERDAAAYEEVIAAFRMPKATESDQAARRAAIEAATKHATLVPLETARDCAEVLESCALAVAEGYAGAVTDAGVGLHAAHTGLCGALYNVEINLGSLKDEAFREETAVEVARLRDVADVTFRKTEGEVRAKLAG